MPSFGPIASAPIGGVLTVGAPPPEPGEGSPPPIIALNTLIDFAPVALNTLIG